MLFSSKCSLSYVCPRRTCYSDVLPASKGRLCFSTARDIHHRMRNTDDGWKAVFLSYALSLIKEVTFISFKLLSHLGMHERNVNVVVKNCRIPKSAGMV